MKRIILLLTILSLWVVPTATAEEQALTPEESVEIHQFVGDMPRDTLLMYVKELLQVDQPDRYDEESLAVAIERVDNLVWFPFDQVEEILTLTNDANYDEDLLTHVRDLVEIDENTLVGGIGLMAIFSILIFGLAILTAILKRDSKKEINHNMKR